MGINPRSVIKKTSPEKLQARRNKRAVLPSPLHHRASSGHINLYQTNKYDFFSPFLKFFSYMFKRFSSLLYLALTQCTLQFFSTAFESFINNSRASFIPPSSATTGSSSAFSSSTFGDTA